MSALAWEKRAAGHYEAVTDLGTFTLKVDVSGATVTLPSRMGEKVQRYGTIEAAKAAAVEHYVEHAR